MKMESADGETEKINGKESTKSIRSHIATAQISVCTQGTKLYFQPRKRDSDNYTSKQLFMEIVYCEYLLELVRVMTIKCHLP